jgi:hypothetical protein
MLDRLSPERKNAGQHLFVVVVVDRVVAVWGVDDFVA